MTGQDDAEATKVGMPVPPQTPGYVQQPPYGQPYGQPPYAGPPATGGYPPQTPTYPPQPGYLPPPGAPPGSPPSGYGPPPGYRYEAPPPGRGGPSAVLIGAFVLLLVLAIGVGAMFVGHLGPFAVAQLSPVPTRTAQASASARPSPSASPNATPSAPPTATPTLPVTTVTPGVIPPTATPFISPTIEPTATPTFPVSAPPSPSASEGDATSQAALLAHVPESFRANCSASPLSLTGSTASVSCVAGDNDSIFITYTLFSDQQSMQAAYDADKTTFGADAGSATCSKGANWPSEYGYTVDNNPAGRVLCSDFIGLAEIYWTDERYSILSWAFATGQVSKADLYKFWLNESGPY